MRKLIAILFLSALALSLCMTAFASNGIFDLGEEPVYLGDPGYGWPVGTIPNHGVRPLAECTHDYPQTTDYYTQQIGCYLYTYRVKICSYCGLTHDKTTVDRELRHMGDKLHTGDGRFICSKCGKVW